MKKDFMILKKNYGEHFTKLCRELFPTILETEGLLSSIILSQFYPNHFLYEDIKKENVNGFIRYINHLADKATTKVDSIKPVKELLSDAGYDFYECHTEEDINRFKKYYSKNEIICTFDGGRLQDCYVFWAVKKDVDKIKREDFPQPKRQDAYGTSVISIQFTIEGHNLSIKNRYNHTVENPDATFSNNLENIIPGLTKAFEKEYNLSINSCSHSFPLSNYILLDDGKYYKFNYKINDICYCPNNMIIDNRKIIKLDKGRYTLVDYFIIDKKEKKIILYDDKINDSFPDTINLTKETKIKETVDKEKIRTITISNPNQDDIIIKTDCKGMILSYQNPNIEIIGDNFLEKNIKLNNIVLTNITEIGNNFLHENTSLKEIILPKIKIIKNNFLSFNTNLTNINIESVEEIESCFLLHNNKLSSINLPNIKKIENTFLGYNDKITIIYFPKLKSIKNGFFECNTTMKKMYLPQVEIIGDRFMQMNKDLEEILLPNIIIIGDEFLYFNYDLKKIKLPKVRKIGNNFLPFNTKLETISIPRVFFIGTRFLYQNTELKQIEMPFLTEKGDYFLYDNNQVEILPRHNQPKRYLKTN